MEVEKSKVSLLRSPLMRLFASKPNYNVQDEILVSQLYIYETLDMFTAVELNHVKNFLLSDSDAPISLQSLDALSKKELMQIIPALPITQLVENLYKNVYWNIKFFTEKEVQEIIEVECFSRGFMRNELVYYVMKVRDKLNSGILDPLEYLKLMLLLPLREETMLKMNFLVEEVIYTILDDPIFKKTQRYQFLTKQLRQTSIIKFLQVVMLNENEEEIITKTCTNSMEEPFQLLQKKINNLMNKFLNAHWFTEVSKRIFFSWRNCFKPDTGQQLMLQFQVLPITFKDYSFFNLLLSLDDVLRYIRLPTTTELSVFADDLLARNKPIRDECFIYPIMINEEQENMYIKNLSLWSKFILVRTSEI